MIQYFTMNSNFWDKLAKPFFVLAPMYDVTDAVFRSVLSVFAKPDVTYTEFVSADGLASIAKEKLMRDLLFSESEHPVVAQIFGANPKNYANAIEIIASRGFDGVDINMGCPDSNIIKQGSCAALIDNPDLAVQIIKEVKNTTEKVFQETGLVLPVSIKTRIGNKKIETERWISLLLEQEPAVITVHGRTAKEMSKAPVHWDEIEKAVNLAKGTGVKIVGNGDVLDLKSAMEKVEKFGVDGVMLGRAIFHNPLVFADRFPSQEEKFAMLRLHLSLFQKYYSLDSEIRKESSFHPKSFALMKKFFKIYISGFDGAVDLRSKLMGCRNAEEALGILDSIKI